LKNTPFNWSYGGASATSAGCGAGGAGSSTACKASKSAAAGSLGTPIFDQKLQKTLLTVRGESRDKSKAHGWASAT